MSQINEYIIKELSKEKDKDDNDKKKKEEEEEKDKEKQDKLYNQIAVPEPHYYKSILCYMNLQGQRG